MKSNGATPLIFGSARRKRPESQSLGEDQPLEKERKVCNSGSLKLRSSNSKVGRKKRRNTSSALQSLNSLEMKRNECELSCGKKA